MCAGKTKHGPEPGKGNETGTRVLDKGEIALPVLIDVSTYALPLPLCVELEAPPPLQSRFHPGRLQEKVYRRRAKK